MDKWLANEANFNLDQKKYFFDPYPLFIGAVIPLPAPLRNASENLNGKTLTLRKALTQIKQSAGSLPVKIALVKEFDHKYGDPGVILLKLNQSSMTTHMFRLIRFHNK